VTSFSEVWVTWHGQARVNNDGKGEMKNAYRVCHRLEVRLRAELSLRDEVGDRGEVSHGLGDIVLLGDSVRDLQHKEAMSVWKERKRQARDARRAQTCGSPCSS
jgi:hypothetical protein